MEGTGGQVTAALNVVLTGPATITAPNSDDAFTLAGTVSVVVADSSFEDPNIGTGVAYDLGGTPWTYVDWAGVIAYGDGSPCGTPRPHRTALRPGSSNSRVHESDH